MNKKYERDIDEIIMFAKCLPHTQEKNRPEKCLGNIIENINDSYHLEKAKYYKETVLNNKAFSEAITEISHFCKNSFCKDCPINKYCNHYINLQRKNNIKKYKMIDLFCGAGGLSLGFYNHNFIAEFANDIEDCCIDTYAFNHPEIETNKIVKGDINKISKNIQKRINGQKIDVVIGGPPCQGFSMANRQRLIDDPRNVLYKSYVEVVKKTKPKFFVMENVKGMLNVANQVMEDFAKIGYSAKYEVLNAKDYGVPQNRERLIYIGCNNQLNIDVDDIFKELLKIKQKNKKYVLGDALYGLKKLEAKTQKNSTENGTKQSGFVIALAGNKSNDYIKLINNNRKYKYTLNHQARYNNDRDIEIFSRMNQGDKSDDPKIADIMPYKTRNDIFKDKYFKLENNKVCKTITAHMKFDCNMYIHPTQARGLTPREAARVQSYPDNYFFRGAYTKTYMQIGNSVPPLLGSAIATVIEKYVEGTII